MARSIDTPHFPTTAQIGVIANRYPQNVAARGKAPAGLRRVIQVAKRASALSIRDRDESTALTIVRLALALDDSAPSHCCSKYSGVDAEQRAAQILRLSVGVALCWELRASCAR